MICQLCGTEFIPRHYQQNKYCSHRCASAVGVKKYRERNPEKVKDRIRKWEKENAHVGERQKKLSARYIFHYAVKKGILIRPEVCQNCGKSSVKIEGHHYRGYDYPLEVIWLCRSCHHKFSRGVIK